MSSSLAKTHVLRFSPSTASDTLDINDVSSGSCSTITNLIPDPSTKNVWCAKPTAATTNDFSNGATPHAGTVSCFIVVGTLVYGMVANTVSGTETPFCIDASNPLAGAAIQVQNGFATGIQPTTLTWPPPWLPTMALVGDRIFITHPGFGVVGPGLFGVIDISVPGFPVYYVTNLTLTGGITAGHLSAGGTGYGAGSTGATTSAQALTGGTGSNASAIFHYTAGVLDWLVIVNPGKSYIIGDVLTVPAYAGGGTGGTYTVDAVQTTGAIQFTYMPQWVAQFYQRAYFGVNPVDGSLPSVVYTDILGRGVTNANQALTFGDNITTVAAAGLGLNNQLGGIVQSLMVFKNTSYIIQITGDAALMTLSVNSLNVATGTTSSRGVVATPEGLAFAAPDGLRFINFGATISDPIGFSGQGVTLPFSYGVYPFYYNVVIACNRNVIRVSLQYQYPGGAATQSEFWYDLNLKVWSGPHATAYEIYGNYKDTWLAIRAVNGVLTKLLTILSYPAINAAYAPNANCELTTAVINPLETLMSQLEIVELQIMTTAPVQVLTMVVSILDQDTNVIATSTFTFSPSTTPTTTNLYPRKITFSAPVVVTRFAVDIAVTAPMAGLSGFKLGDIYIRYRDLGYLQELPG